MEEWPDGGRDSAGEGAQTNPHRTWNETIVCEMNHKMPTLFSVWRQGPGTMPDVVLAAATTQQTIEHIVPNVHAVSVSSIIQPINLNGNEVLLFRFAHLTLD